MQKITEMLDIQYPLFLGAMGGISRPDLVVAVSEAGGLGILETAGAKADAVRDRIKEIKSRTDKPFGVNIAIITGNAEQILQVLEEEGVKTVVTGAGDPLPYIDRIHQMGGRIFPVVPSARVAKKVADAGADGVIVEGTEAGGHVGEGTTMTLVRHASDILDIPVIAAGGIADGHGVVAAYALGASAVQIGTLFVASTEAPIHENYKQAIVNATDTSTFVSGRETGAPIRIEKNNAAKTHHKLDKDPNVGVKEIEGFTIPSLVKAAYQGNTTDEIVTYGQIASLVKEIRPVKEIIEGLFKEADEVLSKLKIQ